MQEEAATGLLTTNVVIASISAGSALLGALIGLCSSILHGWITHRLGQREKRAGEIRDLYAGFLVESRRFFQVAWAIRTDPGREQEFAQQFDALQDRSVQIMMLDRDPAARDLVTAMLRATDIRDVPLSHLSQPMPDDVHKRFFGPREQLLARLRKRWGVE